MAAIHITGALQTTANDVLDAHADILPMELLINKHCHHEAIHLATLPTLHPLHSHVKEAAKRKPKKHPAQLHHILHAYKIKPDQIEKIQATQHPLTWRKPFKTQIAPDRETAIQEEEADRADVRIYSDGSGIENQIGAAAVLYRGNHKKGTLKYKLGSVKHHTVYEGELVGMGLGTELL
jgi:hypothetical protein